MPDEIFSSKMKELRESTGLNRKEFCEKFDMGHSHKCGETGR